MTADLGKTGSAFIGSPKRWDRSAALTSTLHWFETELLTREENLLGLMAVNRDLIGQAETFEHTGRRDGRVSSRSSATRASNIKRTAGPRPDGSWQESSPRVGFIVTNLALPNRAVVRFYHKRGIAEQWIKEGEQAAHWTRLSCHRFRANKVRLQLSVLAYYLGQSVAAARAATAHRALVAHQSPAAPGQDGWTPLTTRTLQRSRAANRSSGRVRRSPWTFSGQCVLKSLYGVARTMDA